MEKRKKYTDWIEEYLDKNLSKKEEKFFEKEIESNTDLKKAFDARIKIAKLWNEATEYERIKKEISNVLGRDAKKQKNVYQRFYAIAAVLVVFIGLSFVFFNQNRKKVTNNDLLLIAADTTANDTMNTYQLKLEPENNKANIYYYKDTTLEKVTLKTPNLISIKQGETIVFSWKSDINTPAVLFVKSLNDSLFLRENILLSDTSFIWENPQLPQGDYIWYINNYVKFGSFKIY